MRRDNSPAYVIIKNTKKSNYPVERNDDDRNFN